jgi:predicted small lipoprotein YifL
MEKFRKYFAIVFSTLLLCGCGLKGNLYDTVPDDEEMTATK